MVTKSYHCDNCYEAIEVEKEMNDTSRPKCPQCGAEMQRTYDMQINRLVHGEGAYGLSR